jgi:hypothetical protein
MNPTQLGVTITGEVATLTITVPALWLLALVVLTGVFTVWTQLRDWITGLVERVRKDDERLKETIKRREKTWEPKTWE